ncbi:MAG TPA: alpha/beta hydrolase [Puia sp.]|nr:alpha/beta hydrolase [Puia sp.]
MRKIFLLLFISLVFTNLYAQPPVAPNGKFKTIKGIRLYYEESGQGVPLILLHAFGGNTLMWSGYTEELAKNYHVIAIDLPGHGRSDPMDTTLVYLHKRAAEYILGLLDELKIDSAYIMGASSGGFITMYMATMRPALAKKIIVIGGQVYYSAQTRRIISRQNPDDPKADRMPGPDPVLMHGKEKAILLARQFYNFRQLYGDPSFTPDVLATITAKTLIIHGDNDPIAPVQNAWDMFNNIRGAHLWVVPGGGHLPFLDPANKADFTRRVEDFLTK